MLLIIAATTIILYVTISGISDEEWPNEKRFCNFSLSKMQQASSGVGLFRKEDGSKLES